MHTRLAAMFGVLIMLFGMLAGMCVIPGVVMAGTLTYEGSTTISEGIMPLAVKAFESKTKIKFASIGGLGSGKGFKAAMEGKVDIGGVSRALTVAEKELKPYYQTIGFDGIAVFINEKNPVKELSKEQVKGIFTGKITSWKDVGGADKKIVVVTEIKTGERATMAAFKELALDGAELGSSKEIDKPHDCVKYVGTDESAVTFATLAFFKGSGVKAIAVNKMEPTHENVKSGAYILSRPLILVSKEQPTGDKLAFFDFIQSGDGQAIVGKNFVPIK
jgi:phosphate transport system substrate-binding protein